jgi:FkbM family methyltransferase
VGLLLLRQARRQRLERIQTARECRERYGWERALESQPMRDMRARYGNYLQVDAKGHPFLVDLRDTVVSQAILYDGGWEPEKSELFAALIRTGDRVIDVGSNIGYYSVMFGHVVGDSGRVVGIEPDPDNARIARENVRLNRLSKTVSIVQAAAGAKPGDLLLYARSGIANRGDHRTWDDGSNEGRRVRVKMVTVDECARGWPSVQAIKMDIQGYEGHALAGMLDTLQRNPDVALVTEFWPSSMRRAGTEPHAFLDELRSLGFAGWRIDERGALAAVDTETIVAELEPDERWADMVFVRREHTHRRLGKLLT